jgi:hypothetical protein
MAVEAMRQVPGSSRLVREVKKIEKLPLIWRTCPEVIVPSRKEHCSDIGVV